MTQTKAMISIDFWDTLVIAEEGGKTRRKIRHEALCEIAREYIRNLPDSEIEAATREASAEFHRVWFNQHRTPTAEELVTNILGTLGVPATQKELDHLVEVFEESLLDSPPAVVPEARDTLAQLAGTYKLTMISDTMYSPGSVLRKFLKQNDMYDYFDDFVFSNELGVSKPNPEAYECMLESTGCDAGNSFHIGDRLNTDVKGAKEVGMKAIYFIGVSGKAEGSEEEPKPDYTCESWKEIGDLLLTNR